MKKFDEFLADCLQSAGMQNGMLADFAGVSVLYSREIEGLKMTFRPISASRSIPEGNQTFQLKPVAIPAKARVYEFDMPERVVYLGVPEWVTMVGWPDMCTNPEGQQMFVSEAMLRLGDYVKKSGLDIKLG